MYSSAMERSDKPRSGIALGGIGAGSLELRQDGIFRNWSIFNNYPLGTGEPLDWREDSMLFFIVRWEVEGEYPQMRILQLTEGYKVGAIQNHYYEFPWLTGVERIEYEARFPFVNMRFSDEQMPLDVELEAFSPFVPHDVKNSSLPAAIFNFTVTSRSEKPVHVMLMASMRNGVGYDVEDKYHLSNVLQREDYRLFEVTEGGMDESHSSFGSQVLASLAPDSTYYTGWEVHHPYYEYVIRHRELPDYDDTDGRNAEDPDTGELKALYNWYGSIAVSRRLEEEESLDHTFVKAWHFPNLHNRGRTRIEGRYYANFFESAVDVADYVVDTRADLRGRSEQFLRDFYDSSAPAFVLDQVNSHLNTFFTSSWLTADGNFGILEGLAPDHSYGPLVTVDVSIYGAMSVSALFPELHKSMMRAHGELQAASGEVGHGINKDFRMTDVQETVQGRLDLPSQYAILVLRGFFWTDDGEYLEEMWPSVKAALDYVLRERDPNGDCLPDMEGAMCTYDNFKMYGASSYVSSLWLSALAKAIDAARVVGDVEAAEHYSTVLQTARRSFEEKLWNGRYYRLFNDADGEHGELDEGCLTDQLIGQWTNHLTGSGDIVERSRVRKALESICGMSMQPWGLVNCRWPEDDFLHPVPEDCWHDQANTVWSGVELAFASFLIYEDMYEQAMAVIDNVDSRYRRWGLYWDHIEFGGHYYRPMSAWGILNAMLGLTINGTAYGFDPKVPQQDLKLFFSYGDGTAHFGREVTDRTERLSIAVCTGTLRCDEVSLGLARENEGVESVKLAGQALPEAAWSASLNGRTARVEFAETVEVPGGQAIVFDLR